MFLQIERLHRTGSNVPPTVMNETIRVDLIQRVRPMEVTDWDQPCTALVLEGEETVICQGSFDDVMVALGEVLTQ